MEKEIFGFEVADNDEPTPHNRGHILYIHQENCLVPSGHFSKGFGPLMSAEQVVASLKKLNIKYLTTFSPDLETVASSPYEIEEDEDFSECEEDGNWNRFEHSEIDKGSKLETLMKKSGIELRILSSEEVKALNEKLEHYR